MGTFRKMLSRELGTFTPTDSTTLFGIIENVKARCISLRNFTNKHNPYKRWVNDELIHIIRERNRYHKLMKKFPNNLFAKNKYLEHC